MGLSFLDLAVQISVALLPPVVVVSGLGEVVVLAPEAASAIPSEYTSYASATEIAAALLATEIDAQTAEDLTAVLSQTDPPPRVWVATYDDATEDPSDAMDRILAADVDVGVAVVGSRVSADLAAMGTWLASGARRWQYVAVGQSADASLLTATPTAALDACQVSSFHLLYSLDAEPTAAAFGGRLAGKDLTSGPVASRVQLLGVGLPTVTSAQQGFLIANGVDHLVPHDRGASASQRLTYGTVNYDRSSYKAVTSSIYAVRRMRAALAALTLAHAITGDPITADDTGVALVEATLSDPLAQLGAAGHWSPGPVGSGSSTVDLPAGFQVTGRVVGDDIYADVIVRIGQEAQLFVINVTGEVV